ncbi:hypothetical protein PMAYCL1PPCAC_32514, partial [Pristionchus mayeri]
CDVVARQRPERNLEFVCESIALFEKCYGLEYKEETRELALEALSKYGPGTSFENDERMLPIYRILGKYSRSMTSTDLYDKLHEKGLFTTSAAFYCDWIEVYILANQMDKAKEILGVMEKAVGTQHASFVQMRHRIFGDVNPETSQPRQAKSKIASLVKPVEAPAHPARRNLFGSNKSPENSVASVVGKPKKPAQPIVEDDPIRSPAQPAKPAHAPPRDEPIVLPNIVDAPPVDLSIVSPSISLMQSGQIPPNFSLPPVFSFSNTVHSSNLSYNPSSLAYKPSTLATTRETTTIRNSIMSTSTMPPMPLANVLSGLPSHPAQINQNQFAVPAIPPFRSDFGNGQQANSENVDPRGGHAKSYAAAARRDITGVLLPAKNFELDPFGELEAEKKAPMSAYEMKRARLQNQQQTHTNQTQSAARRIFPDATSLLSDAFQSININSPSTSKQ